MCPGGGGREGQAAVIRLDGARSDESVRSLGEGIGNQKLQFTRLVSASRQSQQIVPLDVNIRAAA
jgi:hypothetical protein